jgi:hypothetical protein
MATPIKSVKSEDVSQLLDHLSALSISKPLLSKSPEEEIDSEELDDRGRVSKRGPEGLTVEGSPLNVTKRIDTLPTPYPFRNLDTIDLEPLKQENIGKARVESGRQIIEECVVVLGTREMGHNTGDHQVKSSINAHFFSVSILFTVQETAKRTQLLLDRNIGCLRRPALMKFIRFIDSPIRSASLADLLRVHELNYIFHLQAKCQEQTSQKQNQQTISTTQPFPYFYSPPGFLDVDTPIAVDSLQVIMFLLSEFS